MQIIRTKDLPRDIQALLIDYEFTGREVRLYTCTEFTCPKSYCDYDITTLVCYNRKSSEHKAIRSGHYESVMNWTPEERAMASDNFGTYIPDNSIWFLVLNTYPKHRASVYCHPTAMALALDKPKLALTRRQEICLFITRSIISSYRDEEARTFKFTKAEWATVKAELFGLKLMTKTGSLTLEGKNRAQGLVFQAWEEK